MPYQVAAGQSSLIRQRIVLNARRAIGLFDAPCAGERSVGKASLGDVGVGWMQHAVLVYQNGEPDTSAPEKRPAKGPGSIIHQRISDQTGRPARCPKPARALR